MKSLPIFFLALGFLSISYRLNAGDYWAETSKIDQFILIENGQPKEIPAVNGKQSFRFSTSPESSIQMVCSKCEESVSIKIFGKKEDAYTATIVLKKEHEPISIRDCFSRYPEKSGILQLLGNIKNAFAEFLKIAKAEKVAVRKAPAFQSGEKVDEDGPKLSFTQTDDINFLNYEELQTQFAVYGNYPITSVYIIKQKQRGEKIKLVLYSGRYELIEQLFKDQAEKSVGISQVSESVDKTDNRIHYRLIWENISNHLFESLEPGKSYQLGIVLDGDNSDHNPYLFNFNFYENSELEEVEKFLNGQ